jgi:predicted ArsR family transcriptional regulator
MVIGKRDWSGWGNGLSTVIASDLSAEASAKAEAIHIAPSREMECFVADAPRNDGGKVEHNQQNCPAGKSLPIYGNRCQAQE